MLKRKENKINPKKNISKKSQLIVGSLLIIIGIGIVGGKLYYNYYFNHKDDDKYKLYDGQGKEIISGSYRKIYTSYNEYFYVLTDDNKYQFILDNNKLSDSVYKVWDRIEDFFIVETNEKEYNVVSAKTGKKLLTDSKNKYSMLKKNNNVLAYVTNDKEVSLYNLTTNKELIKTTNNVQYDDNYFTVREDQNTIYYNYTNGKKIID